MKTVPLLCALCVSVFPILRAENLERISPSSLSLSAQLSSNSAKATDHFKTDYGSSDIHTEKERGITGQVRNLGRKAAAVGTKVIWIGKHTGTNDRFVLSTQTELASIAPGGTQLIMAWSGPITGSDMNLVAIGKRYTEGEKIEGWVVTVRDSASEALLAIRGSDLHLEEFARTPGSVPPLRKEIVTFKVGRSDETGYIAFQGPYMFHILTQSKPPTAVRSHGTLTLLDSRFVDSNIGGPHTIAEYALPGQEPQAAQAVAIPPAKALPAGVVHLAFTTAEHTADGQFARLADGEVFHIATSTPAPVGKHVNADIRATGGFYEYTGKDGVVRRVKEYAGTGQ